MVGGCEVSGVGRGSMGAVADGIERVVWPWLRYQDPRVTWP